MIMGILNVTPDSFSDGGLYASTNAAIERGLEMFEQGATIIDVGGESTRPGALPISASEECRRVLEVVEALSRKCTVSVDTSKPEVAHAAVQAGASIINDVSASLAHVAAERQCGWIAMHMKGKPRTMQITPRYDNVLDEVNQFLIERTERARLLGVKDVWVDPGIGFGKTDQHNLHLLRNLSQLGTNSSGVVIGISRKRFIGNLLNVDEPRERLSGALAVTALAVLQGVKIFRTHDVPDTVQAVRMAELLAYPEQ